ncbi:MAG: S8 family serine peptidase, partial [Frankiaceae bacterium]|nr:S8 family serine peptidase [Frankiaceae bacterium]
AAAAVRAAGGTVRDALPLVGGVSAELPEGAVLAPAFRVVENSPLTLASKNGVGKAGDPTAVRTAMGMGPAAGEGSGVTVAVVDTGVAKSAELPNVTRVDVSESSEGDNYDAYGHGTFVAGIIAGTGAADGTYAGVAPGAHVLDVRVADAAGTTDLATVLKGLQAVADHKGGVDVLNLSLSSGSPLPYQVDPLAQALEQLWAQGVVVVVPTGNDGPSQGSVSSPGSDPVLLTVGALDTRRTPERTDDGVPQFSGRGPAPQGVAKPDLVAAGVSLVSVAAPGSTVAAENPSAKVGKNYFRGSGTSFATAAVSGAAAVLIGQNDGLGPEDVKAHLRATAYSAKALKDVRDAGAGGLDLGRALTTLVEDVDPVDIDGPPADDADAWHAFLEALLTGDREAAAAAWGQLSPETHAWAASRWAGLSLEASRWAANSWSASRWAGEDGTGDEWQMRYWAASRWAASRWASDGFVASRWAANSWSASRWAASRWAGDEEFAASRWAASRWSAASWG